MCGRGRIARVAVVLSVLGLSLTTQMANAQDRENCLFCHQYPGLARLEPDTNRVRLFYVDPGYVHSLRGAHSRLACTDCHVGEQVSVVPHQTVSPVDCTRQCHVNAADSTVRRFSHDNIAEMLAHSAHRPQRLANLPFTGGPLLNDGQSTCLYCHDEPVYRDAANSLPAISQLGERAFDRCDVCHKSQLPVDTRFFLRHVASRLEPTRSQLETAQVCAVCHSDPAIIEKLNLSDAVASYMRSFHGKAALLGDPATAGCVSCHVKGGENAHLLLGHEESASAVSPQNVGDSCSSMQCHPGASPAIAATAVHLDLANAGGSLEFWVACAFILLTIFSFAPTALLVVLELVHRLFGWQHEGHAEMHDLTNRVLAHPLGRKLLNRFSPTQRMQHWILVALFVTLSITGFPLKFPEADWSARTVHVLGGTAATRSIHHYAGLALMIGLLVHAASILRSVWRKAVRPNPNGAPLGWMKAIFQLPFLPNLQDLSKARMLFAYLLRARRDRPAFGRATIAEKLDYIGVVWGTTLLGITGLMLWGEQIVSQMFGGRIFNIATIIHTYEAFLAVIHVGVLHISTVVFAPAVFPLSPAMTSSQTPGAKLAEEHGEFVLEVAAQIGVSTEGAHHAG